MLLATYLLVFSCVSMAYSMWVYAIRDMPVRDERLGTVLANCELCNGSEAYVEVCPLGAIRIDPKTGKIIK